MEFSSEGFPGEFESPFSEQEETELAMELLSVSSEAELEQFLGNVFKKAWQGIKKVAKPLGGALKGIAKAALPMVGGALGSFIPIPGVGTALGSALGGAISKALEVEMNEMGELAQEDREFETARRVVRIAGTAARLAGDSDGSPQAVRGALLQAVRAHAPHFQTRAERCAAGGDGEAYCGPWRKRRAERFPLLELP
ncbi:hypothetical protein GJ700_23660 [Duganella sp. FT92W]|uniref:Uncharacterized protein n=1 Tax=Pseudoduganella rivuli TaxID=2666085 RepID=A0A7X2IRL5_9BURK|nr:hypothetical protein [Pseudoduganella rivuli]MRV74713.1 hypothetical protein [Pseudoduganella rivuli]